MQALADHVMQLPLRERMVLPNHARALLEAERIAAAMYVDLLEGVARDQHWLSVDAVAEGTMTLVRATAGKADAPLRRWAKQTLGPHGRRIGLQPKPGEPATHGLLRTPLFRALVEAGAAEDAIEQARGTAERFVANSQSADTGALGLQLSMAARSGDKALHDGLIRALKSTLSPSVREDVISALGSFHAPDLLEGSLSLLMDGTLRAQDYRTVTRAAGESDATQAVLWQWYVAHEAELVQRLGTRMATYLPWVLAGFCDEAKLEEARKHFEANQRFGSGASHNLNQAVETATRCAELRKRQGPALVERLAQRH
jgi:hypothetical protein